MAVIDFMFNISKGAMIDTINNMIYNIALYVFVFIICMWILVCIVRLFVRGLSRVIPITYTPPLQSKENGKRKQNKKRSASYRVQSVGKKANTNKVVNSDLDDEDDFNDYYDDYSSSSYYSSSNSSSSESSYSNSNYNSTSSYKNEDSSRYDSPSYNSSYNSNSDENDY
ncbi:hypothetical protein [Bacillus toyonensis]|uniref:hypothetical protein n=1 Tax=Bacillus toyonensis TaxID=155322 RepID=UPI00211D729F|nr:hypothetical protein [Bacillus toyonensis]